MKLLVLSASLFALTTQAFIIPESEAKTVLSRERRWGRTKEEKTKARNTKLDRRLNEKCVVQTCEIEEWAEISENREDDGYDSKTLRSAIKRDLFRNQYTECVGGAKAQSDKVKRLRQGCLDAVKNLYHQWPTTTPKPTTTPVPTTPEPTTVVVTTTELALTTVKVTTAEKVTECTGWFCDTATTKGETITKEATTTQEPTTKEATTTQEPTTVEKATTTQKDNSFTETWGTTTRRNRRRKNKNRG
jgi:hypothetical protein